MDRLAAMEVFVRVVETGTFSGAARQLRVGQPAVSKAVAQLEQHLGVPLLLRSSRGLAVTEAGHNYYGRAKRAIEEANEAELAARGAGANLTGRLRICVAVSFGRLLVIPHLPVFLASHPELSVDVVMDDRAIDVIEEGIDVALRMGSLKDSSATARKIGQCPRMVLATPAYFERMGRPSTPSELIGHEAIVFEQPALAKSWTFKQDTREVSVALKGRVSVTAGEGLRAAVLAGIGFTVSSTWLFENEIRTGEVEAALTDWELPALDLWAMFPARRKASAKARAFASFVERIVSPLHSA